MKNFNAIESKIREAYIDRFLESSKKVSYKDLTKQDGLTAVLYKDLPETEIDGYPVASDFVDGGGNSYSFAEYAALPDLKKSECELRYFYLPNYHEIYVGTSGSGKTTGCCEPQLRAISSQKNKPNLFVTDPKGELFDRNAKHLREQGYNIKVMNFKEPMRSDRWNPFKELYDLKMRSLNVGRDGDVCQCPVAEGLIKMPPFDAYRDTYYRYEGYAFPTAEASINYIEMQKCLFDTELDSLVNQIASLFIVIKNTKDSSWEIGAQNALRGLIHCLLEEAADKESGFTADMMTLRTLQRYYGEIRDDVVNGDKSFRNHPLISGKSERTLAFMKTMFDNAPTTRRSYCGVFDGQMVPWFQAHIMALTAGSNIDLESYNDDGAPFAIFLITRDYDKSDFTMAGIFVDWVYRTMLEKAEKSPNGRNKRALHFLLDEFGNIPEIKDFECKISTARSRNIWFHLIVQSYKQIEIVYDNVAAGRSTVIRDNCNSQIFLGAQNRETKEQFSRECGRHSIPTLSSLYNDEDHSLTETALVPVSELDLIRPGEIYIKRVYKPVFTSRFIRSYEAAIAGIFKNFSKGLHDELPFCPESFDAPRYIFQFKHKKSKGFSLDDLLK